MKTKELHTSNTRYSTIGRTYRNESARHYRFRRRSSHIAANLLEFDQIPELLLPELTTGLTAAEILADLSYGRD